MDKHRIRRTILDTVKYFDPVAASIEDIHSYPGVAAAGITLDQVQSAVLDLISYGFLRNLMPGWGMALRLTPEGRAQIERDAPLDERVWGELAL